MNKLPKFYDKNIDSLINDFFNLSSEYTPEWDVNISSNDLGVSFAKIFCSMQEDTIDRLNKSVNNIYATLLNFIGVFPSPCVPSKTFAVIFPSKNSDVHIIKKGTKLIAVNNKKSNIIFETLEDEFVIDNKINSIFMSDVNNNKIVIPYNELIDFKPFEMFDFNYFKNLQRRHIYIYDNSVFDISNSSIKFEFKNSFSKKSTNDISDIIHESTWEYFDGKNWEKISSVNKNENNLIEIKIDKKINKFNILNEELRCLRISPSVGNNIDITDILYYSEPVILKADSFISNNEVSDVLPLFPFNERFHLYDTFVIKSDEAFNKSGANIVITADFDFRTIESEFKNYIKNYKLIMSDIDFTETEPLNIQIENVIWEYWKKNTWAPIKGINKKYGKFFQKDEKSQRHVLEFICPDDISETTIDSVSGLFIRARISKITNQYSNYFNYISPYLKKLEIKYSYDKPHVCKEIILDSNLERKKINLINNDKIINIFKFDEIKNKSIYFSLSNPISAGILNIFFDIEEKVYDNNIVFKWEYWGKNANGKCSWKMLRILDYTNGLLKAGNVKIIFAEDFQKTKIFNQEGYFIRISMINSFKEIKHFPKINGIYLNSVQIIQKETIPFEYFYVKEYEKNKICSLSSSKNKNIFDIEVWVNEKDQISSSECEKIKLNKPNDIEFEKDSNKNIKKIWIKWEQVNNILNSDFSQRVYEFNYQTSEVRFGDGIHGKIPSENYGKNIRIKYSISDGEDGNISEYSIKNFNSRVPFASQVYNVKKALGGLNHENIDFASKRTLSKISNGNRIISKRAFEQGILFNDSRIFKIKCFPHVDEYENSRAESLTVVILPKNYNGGYENFADIKESALKFIKRNAPFHIANSDKLYIREVTYVKFLFKIISKIDNFQKYQDVYDKINSELKQFIDPIHGGNNKNGFDIGHLPSQYDILNNINFIDGSYITKFEVYTSISTKDGDKEILLSDAQNMKFTVPIFHSMDLDIQF